MWEDEGLLEMGACEGMRDIEDLVECGSGDKKEN